VQRDLRDSGGGGGSHEGCAAGQNRRKMKRGVRGGSRGQGLVGMYKTKAAGAAHRGIGGRAAAWAGAGEGRRVTVWGLECVSNKLVLINNGRGGGGYVGTQLQLAGRGWGCTDTRRPAENLAEAGSEQEETSEPDKANGCEGSAEVAEAALHCRGGGLGVGV